MNLNQLIKAKSITARELARRCKVHPTTIAHARRKHTVSIELGLAAASATNTKLILCDGVLHFELIPAARNGNEG